MAQIIINLDNLPLAIAQEVLEAFSSRYGYADQIQNPLYDDTQPIDPITNPVSIPNPQTKKDFAKSIIIEWIKREYRDYKMSKIISAISNDLTDIA